MKEYSVTATQYGHLASPRSTTTPMWAGSFRRPRECTRRHGAAYGAASASAALLSIRDRCSIAIRGLTTTEALPRGEGLGALVVLAAMVGTFRLVDDDVVAVVGVVGYDIAAVGVVGYDVAAFVGILLARVEVRVG